MQALFCLFFCSYFVLWLVVVVVISTMEFGEGSRHVTRGYTIDERLAKEGFGGVQFEDHSQKLRFLALTDRIMQPTRFIHRYTLSCLGLKEEVKKMLKKSGCSGLYRICEQTYRCLTLEFLSSYSYEEGEGVVKFRLLGHEKNLSLAELGNLLGCRTEGELTSPRYARDILWQALIGLHKGGPNRKFRLHLIQHPVIRLWCRLVGNTYFARAESTNMKDHEIAMLLSTLNIDRGERFKINVAHHVAKHFDLLATGVISPILIGGLVTHLAKELYNGIDETALVRKPGDNSEVPPTMDISYLTRLYYIKGGDSRNTWWWKLNGNGILRLPVLGPLFRLNPVVQWPNDHSEDIDFQYYLLKCSVLESE